MMIYAMLQGSLLDDATLVDVLADSKITSVQVGEQLVVAEETNILIDAARELYRYFEKPQQSIHNDTTFHNRFLLNATCRLQSGHCGLLT